MLRGTTVPDRTWIEKHRVCWEHVPLREMVKGHGLESHGACLRLFARVDVAEPERPMEDVLRGLHANCVALLEEALAGHAASLRVDIDAFDYTGYLRPETQHAPEVETTARIVADLGGEPDFADLHATLLRAERRLREHGLHEGAWDDGPSRTLLP